MAIQRIKNWNDESVEAVQSRGGVWAFPNYSDGLMRTFCRPWPASELVQKLYISDLVRFFNPEDQPTLAARLGYYCDLQSAHSEDAIVWSYFGPIMRAPLKERLDWWNAFTSIVGLQKAANSCEISLWRRVPHPDNLKPGGPEIDVLVSTERTILLVEAKWRSGEGGWQGVDGKSSQLELREKFVRLQVPNLYPDAEAALSYLTLAENALFPQFPSGIQVRNILWKQLLDLPHSHREEFRRYYDWKRNLIPRKYAQTPLG